MESALLNDGWFRNCEIWQGTRLVDSTIDFLVSFFIYLVGPDYLELDEVFLNFEATPELWET